MADDGKTHSDSGSDLDNQVIENHNLHQRLFTLKNAFRMGIKDAIVTEVLYPRLPAASYERRYEYPDVIYGVWDPSLSMLGAAIFGGLPDIYIGLESVVLYLEPSATTLCHISDIVGSAGMVYVVSNDPVVKSITTKLDNAQHLDDNASNMQEYKKKVNYEVDVMISELACANQSDILDYTALHILKKAGRFVALVKSVVPRQALKN
ncbi:hypothetical protein MKX03_012441 [Papaver bracteatum]|nr:hypothetical protein MKX03_012441 [Papaver bracteatum]